MSKHTVVIGGGVIGVCTAYYLAEKGQTVTLCEQDKLGCGASFGNAGQITPGHLALNRPGTMWRNLGMLLKPASPLFVPFRFDPSLARWFWRFHRACNEKQVRETTRVLAELGHLSFDLFKELATKLEFGFYDAGSLEVCESDSALKVVKQEAELLHSFGYTSKYMNEKEVKEFEPAVSGKVAGAVYHCESATCDPHLFVLELASATRKLGAEIIEGIEVKQIQPNESGVTVVTNEKELQADSVVIAGGAWTPQLASQLGLKLPIQPGKGYHLDLQPNGVVPKTPFVLSERRIFVSRIREYVRLAGTLEFSGFNLEKRQARITMLRSGTRDHFSGVDDLDVLSEWCHLRPMSPDGLPMIGPLPDDQRIWVVSGHGMLGLTQGPITGQLVADAIIDGESKFDLTPMRPDRF